MKDLVVSQRQHCIVLEMSQFSGNKSDDHVMVVFRGNVPIRHKANVSHNVVQ